MSKSKPANTEIASSLLRWYDRERRELPWRAPPGATADPYAVWLSEVMLQQTTTAAVSAFYARFLTLWPDVAALATAPAEAVMQAWAGLGYYSRARNLHACAKQVVAEFGGKFPQEERLLRTLPGIGPYTAAAIAAIAFGRHAAVVDGNIERVASRLLALEAPLPRARREIAAFVGTITPKKRPGDFAQALMDLGAGVCTPRNPACGRCPLTKACKGFALGDPQRFPRKPEKKPRPLRRGAVFYLRRADGAVLTRTRPEKGLLGGMVEFCGGQWRAEAGSLADAPIDGVNWVHAGEIAHVFTHFALKLDVFAGAAPHGAKTPDHCRWLDAEAMKTAALPSVMRKVESAALAHLAASDLSAARKLA